MERSNELKIINQAEAEAKEEKLQVAGCKFVCIGFVGKAKERIGNIPACFILPLQGF